MKKEYKPHESTFYKKANVIAVIAYMPAFIFMLSPGTVHPLVGYLILAFGFLLYFMEKKSNFVKIHALLSALFYEINMLFLFGMDNVFYYTGYAETPIGATAFALMHEIIMICTYMIPVYCIFMAAKYRTVSLPFYKNLIEKIMGDKLIEDNRKKRKKGKKVND